MLDDSAKLRLRFVIVVIFSASRIFYAREMGDLFSPGAGYSVVKSPFDFLSTVLNDSKRVSRYKGK